MACDIRLIFDLIPQNRSFLDLTTVFHFYLLLSVFHLIKVPAIAWLSSTITMQPSTKPKAQDITMQVLLPKRFGLYRYLPAFHHELQSKPLSPLAPRFKARN